jgi:hopanoid biosynthesis associated protein HpnK
MKLIVNADDFGQSHEINQAVIQAHREGILTSASLMVAGAAFDEAVRLAWQTPTLSVGLHVAVVDAPAVLPLSQIPRLLDDAGKLPSNPVWAGLRYALDGRVREELGRELAAQFSRFAATGLPLSHVDGHLHLHVHPTVFHLLLPLMLRYRARGFRLACAPPPAAWGRDPREFAGKAASAAALALLSRRCQRLLRGSGIAVAAQTYGFLRSGHMDERYVLDLLSRINGVSAEIYFHPTTGHRTDLQGPNPGDLQTLLSTSIRRTVVRRRLKLCGYPDLFAPSDDRRAVSA